MSRQFPRPDGGEPVDAASVRGTSRPRGGFTLLELAIVIVVVAILAGLSLPVLWKLRSRAQRIRCMNNLTNLSVAANLYIQDKGMWPQIPVGDAGSPPEEFAQAWVDALAPFGIPRETWICPTIQNLLNNPDYSTAATARVDYIATPFDDKPGSPHQWPRQPWFVERGDVHGHGNLIIFTDGSISDLKSVLQTASPGP